MLGSSLRDAPPADLVAAITAGVAPPGHRPGGLSSARVGGDRRSP